MYLIKTVKEYSKWLKAWHNKQTDLQHYKKGKIAFLLQKVIFAKHVHIVFRCIDKVSDICLFA